MCFVIGWVLTSAFNVNAPSKSLQFKIRLSNTTCQKLVVHNSQFFQEWKGSPLPLGRLTKFVLPLGGQIKKIGKVSVLIKTHFFHGAGRGGSDPFSGTLNVRGRGRSSAYGKFQKNNIFFIETFPSKSNFPRSILGAFPILPSHIIFQVVLISMPIFQILTNAFPILGIKC